MEEEKRIWNLRLNLDDFNSEYLKLRSDGDRFSFFLGFHCGCMNGPSDETDPKPFICGFAIGSAMYQKALALSQANSGRAMVSVESRRGKYGTAQPGRQYSERSLGERSNERRTDAQALFEPNELTNQRTNDESNNEERKTNKESPLYPPKGKRFVPPTESEWVAYCGETWKDWHPECSTEAWAYYESKGWRIGSAPCKDWKATARTAHGNARSWGKLQPVAGATRAANSPGSPPSPRQMTPEEQNRLRGHRLDLERAERDLRIARNRPHDYDVDEAARKVDEVRARILKMGADPDEKGKVA